MGGGGELGFNVRNVMLYYQKKHFSGSEQVFSQRVSETNKLVLNIFILNEGEWEALDYKTALLHFKHVHDRSIYMFPDTD